MAKQAVGPVIRYLDKAVLAACALVFLYFVAMYGVMSPNKVGAEGQDMFGPGEIDPQIRAEAERLRERLLTAEPPVIDHSGGANPTLVIPNLSELDDVLALARVPAKITSPVQPGLPVPERGGRVEQQRVDLVEVVALEKPRVHAGRSGVYLAPPTEFKGGEVTAAADASFLQDANWTIVFSQFNRAEQERRFRDAGYGRYAAPIVLGLDLQRRLRLPGGGWSDWSAIEPVSRMRRPTISPPAVERGEKGVYAVDPKVREDIDLFFDKVSKGENNGAQCDLLRPLFPAIAYGDPWRIPQVDGLDVQAMDADFQATPLCRYPECDVQAEQIDPNASFDDLYKQSEEAIKAQNFELALRLAEAAIDHAKQGNRERDERKAKELLDKIQFEKARAVAAMATKQMKPIQLVWAHDATDLQSGRTYQYRARIRLLNPYCGQPTLLNDPLNAAVVELNSEWSEPSDPIIISPDTLIFVRSDRPANQEVKVEVFKWYAGSWLMRQFSVTPGDRIGEIRSVKSPRSGEKVEVDFFTGAVVVDVDFRHRATIRDKRTSRFDTVDTTALIYRDSAGSLRQNVMAFDKVSPTYDELKRLVPKE